jgi:hypothetical protein
MARDRRDEAAPTVNRGALSSDHPYIVALELGYLADPSVERDETDYTIPGQFAATEADE